jgi:HD-GYP domain-containing protein (c-di-GMP phosphodiesterase class II)
MADSDTVVDSLLDLVGPLWGVRTTRYGKRTLIALSHAMEDRGLESPAHRPLVFAGFQRARFFAHDRARYEAIAAGSTMCVVAAGGLESHVDDRLTMLGVGPGDAFWRDWTLVVYGGASHASVLVARDLPEHDVDGVPTRDRAFEAAWSYDPSLAHAAARWVETYLTERDPELGERWAGRLAELPGPAERPDAGVSAIGGRLVSAMESQLAREQADSRRLQLSYEATIAALAHAAEARDAETDEHLDRVARRSVAVGRVLGMGAAELETLRQGARLHDVGKIAIRDAVLSKPGPLDDHEMEEMRRHSAIGAGIVDGVPGLRGCVPIVRHHHERWDGGGYPDGLAGEAIPLAARVVAVVDSFDAMTSERPHRRAMSHEVALARVREGCGTQFCPRCVEAFEAVLTLEALAEEADALVSAPFARSRRSGRPVGAPRTA